MKNYVQVGDVLELTAPYARNSGEGALVGSIFGVACTTVANGAKASFAVKGVFDVAKATGAITEGALVYWDNTALNVTTTASGNTLIGHAVAAAQSGDATARILIR